MDEYDSTARHWVVVDKGSSEWVASARITVHKDEHDGYRDIKLFMNTTSTITTTTSTTTTAPLLFPVVDLGRLVVLKSHRQKGLASVLNNIRFYTAKDMGMKTIIVTASAGNKNLLLKMGFYEINHTVTFEDRPNTCFYAMQYIL